MPRANVDVSESSDLDAMRSKLDGILEEADRALDQMREVDAEEYIQQNRQSSGE